MEMPSFCGLELFIAAPNYLLLHQNRSLIIKLKIGIKKVCPESEDAEAH
jgi:hypothetical protein